MIEVEDLEDQLDKLITYSKSSLRSLKDKRFSREFYEVICNAEKILKGWRKNGTTRNQKKN